MSRYDYPDASLAVVQPLTEEQLAAQRARNGEKVRLVNGRFWRETLRGFFEPIHWLARLAPTEATRPALAWGFRAALDDEDTAAANASLPLHLIGDLSTYEESTLPSDARRAIRRLARQEVQIIQVTDPRILRDQGYDILLDWHQRVGRPGPPLSRDEYLNEADKRVNSDGWLTLAAIEGNRLLGYQTAFAVDDVAYLHEIKVATAVLSRGLTAVLDFEAVKAFKRIDSVRRATIGLHEPEKPSLTAYKVRHGFPVVQVPARVWMLRPAELFLRLRSPMAYYRLTGRGLMSVIGSITGSVILTALETKAPL